ncbi:glycerol-3-phosphate dehydrogenase [Actimicrobium sp. CCC2.4]|uniref:glycerol-3-phosphate dehydrogenase n=1 Tax=Actimicrobium sp. CCC2.4 TaxID=3048606 RepID=UPI002AC97D0D|nr:glycerol-3-phosphate dehydrogenase [Actimicrobium sp. CCC2.4]MEB0136280.1 glycerol-3-phosphate dehydrogenase [Actimicrobium sp. CCC2.4]WPX33624.1 glycerol-3-phosphate dehydrogenase [Actimicrobium sp. CCC2.4]
MVQNQSNIEVDVLVVGGGINGAGIARDAAGRGLSVLLCEKDDLAAHTSSASTKLIHGGLRYLEHYEFNLVRKALIEREVLLRSAPHIMWPLRFVMPHDRGQRPAWMIRIGLFLYDKLARREMLPGSHGVNLRTDPTGTPLKSTFTRGFMYSDGWVDDARLVVLNAIDAASRGAQIHTHTTCVSAVRHDKYWAVTLRNEAGDTVVVHARSIVNAAGPWAAHFLQDAAHQPSTKTVRLIKGSHIVVKRLFTHPHAYIFQHPDGRIVFAIPYEDDFTLIGTTDLEYHGDTNKVVIEQHEIDYLCELTSRYFKIPIVPTDVVWSYSGVRPLVDDASAAASEVTRDYRLEFDTGADAGNGGAPMLSVFGGKITTFRKLAEEAVDLLAPALGNHTPSWTADACLPGGDLYGPVPANRAVLEFDGYVQGLQKKYAWLPAKLVARYARAYGTRIDLLLADKTGIADLGEEIATGLYATEVHYLMQHEWASCAADILWRRSKLGLHLPADTAQRLDSWMAAQHNN